MMSSQALRRIIPAYAGSTSPTSQPLTTCRDHPRIRGEHGADDPVGDLARGIIPAYAGSTRCYIRQRRVLKDHPRIRGEHIV